MIAVDWGSSSLRAFRLDAGGRVRDARRSNEGVLKSEGRYAGVLESTIVGWDDPLIVMAGMIGSRQGWQEAPYVACPANAEAIARAMVQLVEGAVPGRQAWLVPGLRSCGDDGMPDVMRGEETQLAGLLPALGGGAHALCLPGTHSKHVRVVDGRIESFRTYMTGELFDVLRRHSVLGRMMAQTTHRDEAAFADGMRLAGQGGGLLHQLFSVRTRALFDELAPDQLSSYLSGLLIGHELNALVPGATPTHIVAADGLADAYLAALALRGLPATRHREDSAAAGMHLLASLRGLPV